MPDRTEIYPPDDYNRALIENVHPTGWQNPTPAPMYNLVVIGAGTAGLVAAAGSAKLGAKVALIERRMFGGDCLNFGCVPSKLIISSSRVSEEVKEAASHGVRVLCGSEPDFPKVMARMRKIRARLSSHDSVERFRELGVDIFLGEGRFTGPNTAEVGGAKLRFKKALIATGARPFHPPVAGLAEAGYLTNETVFSLTHRPRRIAVLGGGAIGCELAQAFLRLGSDVTLLHNKPRLMDREDPDASEVIARAFMREGMRVVLGDWRLASVTNINGEKILRLEKDGEKDALVVDEILVGVGRSPNVEGLGLRDAGVVYDTRKGVEVDDHLRTSNHDIYAAGDICLKFKFTHTADAAARIVIRNALFHGRAKLSRLTVPWCTYTDPEVAHVGMYPEEAVAGGMEVDTWAVRLSEVDRAVMEGREDGFVKIHTRRGADTILGATIVAAHAGEMIGELALAIKAGVGLKGLSELIHPYPTVAEAIRQAADQYNLTRLTPRVGKALARWLERARRS